MPRQETILQVFVASPSDVAEERAALEDVIRELNSTWGRTLGCRLDLVRWETHAVPGMGQDAQDVVNRSVPQDADIFIGILWSRFGTPTHRAESGTREEFDIAFARYRRDQNAVRLMFYFKDEALAPSQIDPEQLRQIQQFRRELGNLGALYSPFNTLEEFLSLVRYGCILVASCRSGCRHPARPLASPPQERVRHPRPTHHLHQPSSLSKRRRRASSTWSTKPMMRSPS
jgi:hypothetical protein